MSLQAAMARVKAEALEGVEVEHGGVKATLRIPVGAAAVEFVKDASRFGRKEGEDVETETGDVLMFVLKWLEKLLPEASGKEQAWQAFIALGGLDGPLTEALLGMMGKALGVPKKRLEAVPTLPGEPA